MASLGGDPIYGNPEPPINSPGKETILEPDIQLMVEIRQSVLSKNLDKQSVKRALDYMLAWNISRPAPSE